MKPLKIALKLAGGKNSVIPPGVIEELVIEIIDGKATFHFKDCRTTKRFCETQRKDGVQTVYSERLSKAICVYPSMTQKEINVNIWANLKALGAKKQ